jgi:predicted HAD superfamily phosphohydrolase YqeG
MLARMRESTGWAATVLQAAPRLLALARHLRPTVHLETIAALDAAFVARHDVSAIIWDADGTLTADKGRAVPAEVRAVLERLGVAQAILSNCDDERLVQLGAMFPDVHVLKGYRLADGAVVMRRLHQGRDQWSAQAGLGQREISPPAGRRHAIRKPSAELIELAIAVLGANRGGVVMVGDQYFTDIAGANLAGIRSVKVATRAPRSFPLAVQLFHRAETIVYRVLYGRGREEPNGRNASSNSARTSGRK